MTSRQRPSKESGADRNDGVDDWYRFLLACAQDHEPRAEPRTPIDELRIFDNSIKRVDDHIRMLAQGLRGWPQSYVDYLKLRMSAFAAKSETGGFDLDGLLARDSETFDPQEAMSRCGDVLEELEQLLHTQEPAESEALLKRLEQLPREAVVDEWYHPLGAFEAWAEAVGAVARARERDQWGAIKAGGYATLLERHSGNGGPVNSSYAEHVQKRLAAAAHELRAHVRGEAGLSPEAIDVLHTLEPIATPPKDHTPGRSRTTLLRVSTELGETSDTGGGDLLNAFVVELAKACQCEVCDFVVVEGSELRPTVISDPASGLKELLEKPYRRGEGIAGSALLLPAASERRWVGTNDLATDPRQSVNHTQLWTSATKSPIYDYWVFPVFRRDGSCFGAFRVFNRLRSCWENGIPWSEGMLWELREVAAWVEAAILPQLSGGDVVPRTVAATAHSAAAQHLKADLGLKWIDEDFLVRLITHATQVAHRKVESLSLGCCLGVFGDPPRLLTHSSPYYAAGEVSFDDEDESRHLEDASAAYAKINPAAGMFVFDPTGRGNDVINLRETDSSSTRGALLRLSEEHPQSLMLFLDRGQDCIRVIADGWIAADYYLSEASGEWTLRMYRQLIDTAVEEKPAKLAAEDVREVFRRAIELSYERIGAMLILGDGTPEGVVYESETPLTDVNLRSLSLSEFADMAAADGAVRIEPTKGVTGIGAIVRVPVGLETEGGGVRPEGSRHSSAAALSEQAPDHMVFVVSENRSLTVMVGGRAIMERR